jgi:hypothetical protein
MSSFPFPVTFKRAAFLEASAGAVISRRSAAAAGALANLPLRLLMRSASAGFCRTTRRPALPGRSCLRQLAA